MRTPLISQTSLKFFTLLCDLFALANSTGSCRFSTSLKHPTLKVIFIFNVHRPFSQLLYTGIIPELYRNCTGIVPELYRSCTGVIPELFRNNTGMVPELYQNGTRITPELCRNNTGIISDWYRNNIGMVPE